MGRSQRILEQIHYGELDTESYTGEDLNTRLEDLSRSDKQILEQYPAEMMKARVLKAMGKKDNSQFVHKFSYQAKNNMLKVFACAAILCAGVMILPNVLSGARAKTEQAAERTKGAAPHINLYKKTGSQAIKLENKTSIACGDVVQVSYIASGENYGAIVSIDGNGVVTTHFPESGTRSAELNKNGEIPLPYSYQLDDAPSFERFIMISSDKPFSVQAVYDTVGTMKNKEEAMKIDFSKYYKSDVKFSDITLIKQ